MVVLDRVNPIDGWTIQGPALDKALLSYVGFFPMPVRHGMTMGELARLFNAENRSARTSRIVPVKGWQREQWLDETGIPWVNPSPNMRTLNEAALYPGICLFEYSNVSVGRGTDTPFEQVGAPWIDGRGLAAGLERPAPARRQVLPGFVHADGRQVQGRAVPGRLHRVVTDRAAMSAVRLGVEVAAALQRMGGDKFDLDKSLKLIGSPPVVARIKAGDDPARIAASWSDDEGRFRLLRAQVPRCTAESRLGSLFVRRRFGITKT